MGDHSPDCMWVAGFGNRIGQLDRTSHHINSWSAFQKDADHDCFCPAIDDWSANRTLERELLKVFLAAGKRFSTFRLLIPY
jgi:hypothetical protein